MRLSTFLLFVLLIVVTSLFSVIVYFLWLSIPSESLEFTKYHANISATFPSESLQFYQNMRYQDKNISFQIEPNCSEKKQNDARAAFRRIEEKTILTFYESKKAQVQILCSNIAPIPENENHFIAGEGGPVTIINASKYAVILLGQVSLYRTETCEQPQIATHEILHALGFDHNNNINSIMYPVTECSQEIDSHIISEIARIYSAPSLPDIEIEKISANKTGSYLNFQITIANNGLQKSSPSELTVSSENKEIKKFQIEKIEIGSRRVLTISNLQIPRKTALLKFALVSDDEEIYKDNNNAEIRIIES